MMLSLVTYNCKSEPDIEVIGWNRRQGRLSQKSPDCPVFTNTEPDPAGVSFSIVPPFPFAVYRSPAQSKASLKGFAKPVLAKVETAPLGVTSKTLLAVASHTNRFPELFFAMPVRFPPGMFAKTNPLPVGSKLSTLLPKKLAANNVPACAEMPASKQRKQDCRLHSPESPLVRAKQCMTRRSHSDRR